MVRSHNKLDSLGIEYGRLGSAVFVDSTGHIDVAKPTFLPRLVEETRKSLRLFGGAALPAHFPPYVGGHGYRALTDKRVALMLQNGRRTTRFFSERLPGLTGELHYAHGLYVTLATAEPIDEKETREITEEMCSDLGRAGLLLRHAGSFGFDFGAAEWCHDRLRDRYVVRLAVPDLPASVWQNVAESVADWWSARERRRAPSSNGAATVASGREIPSRRDRLIREEEFIDGIGNSSDLQSQVMLEFTAGAVEATCLPARAVPAGLLVGSGDDEVPAAFPGLVEVPKPGQTTS